MSIWMQRFIALIGVPMFYALGKGWVRQPDDALLFANWHLTDRIIFYVLVITLADWIKEIFVCHVYRSALWCRAASAFPIGSRRLFVALAAAAAIVALQGVLSPLE